MPPPKKVHTVKRNGRFYQMKRKRAEMIAARYADGSTSSDEEIILPPQHLNALFSSNLSLPTNAVMEITANENVTDTNGELTFMANTLTVTLVYLL